MILIDTHTHLYLPEFDSDRDMMVARALEAGVESMLMPNINSASFPEMMNAAGRYPGICLPMVGLHPTSVKNNYREELGFIESVAGSAGFVAVGESGIDLYHDTGTFDMQKKAFRANIELALKLELPIVIHARNSFREIFDILADYKDTGLKGVFHAFTGSVTDMKKIQDMGFMLGIGGIVTFKNSTLPDVVREADIHTILLETDAPYLAPSPHRGKRNESSYLREINNRLAALFDISPEETAAITTENAKKLFNLAK